MAQIQADSGQDFSISATTLINLTGGLLSIALVIGVGVWGYKTLARDVSDVPVVRAAQDPMRVAPEDPGGMLRGNTGLAVNKVAADGVAEKPADRLVLAPAPVDLTREDESSRDLRAMMAAENRAAELAREAVTTEAAAEEGTAAETDAVEDDSPLGRLTAMLMKDAVPFSNEEIQPAAAEGPIAEALRRAQDSVEAGEVAAPTPVETGQAEIADLEEVAFSPENAIVPTAVVRPRMRPGAGSTSGPQAMIAAPQAAMTSIDVDPKAIPVGTRLTQLGAYDSIEIAQKEWDRFAARFSDYMSGKQRVIQQASTGGRTFYRLRVMGFDDLAAARYFCAALVAENADCIPVVAK